MASDRLEDNEMSGVVFAVFGQHLIAFNFGTRQQLGRVIHHIDKNGLKPYFKAREEFALDMVINTVDKITPMNVQAEMAPKCEDHGTTMVVSAKKGCKWYCKKKVGDGYCKHFVDDKGRYHRG